MKQNYTLHLTVALSLFSKPSLPWPYMLLFHSLFPSSRRFSWLHRSTQTFPPSNKHCDSLRRRIHSRWIYSDTWHLLAKLYRDVKLHSNTAYISRDCDFLLYLALATPARLEDPVRSSGPINVRKDEIINVCFSSDMNEHSQQTNKEITIRDEDKSRLNIGAIKGIWNVALWSVHSHLKAK